MGLKKAIDTPSGVQGDYLKIAKFDGSQTDLTIRIACYVNQAARQANKMPLDFIVVSFGPNDSEEILTGNNAIQKAYNKLKQRDEFSGSEDV